ncbi:MAG TPA: PKD domain-containing protein [Vicinamibacterales bacterium]|nr:PKD domain-containing protein [Vicinamibacterales bacterium]
MVRPTRVSGTLLALLIVALGGGTRFLAQRDDGDRKPSLSLRATPPVGFSPLRVRVVVDVRGGADDYADFYCPNIEWDWGDGTVSASSEDCDPYEPGKSTIRRRFTAEHVFRQAGAYQIYFRLKQRNKVIAAASANIQVRAGARDEFDR